MAEYLGRSYDLLSSMSFSAIWMLLEQPYRLQASGFLISYVSVLGIGLIIPFVEEKIFLNAKADQGRGEKKRKGNYLRDFLISLRSSLLLFFLTMPLVMRFYYECSPYSILLNPFVLACMAPLMISALLAGILGLFFYSSGIWISSFFFHSSMFLSVWRLVCLPAVLILRIYHWSFAMVRQWPGALWITGCLSIASIFVIYLAEGLFLLFLFWQRTWDGKRRGCTIMVFLCSLLLMGSAFHSLPAFSKSKEFQITMLDVGQGDGILLRMPDGKNMLIDGGSTSEEEVWTQTIKPALYYYGISYLDYVVITHMDEDHISGIYDMLQSGYPVSQLLTGSYYEGSTCLSEDDLSGIDKIMLNLARKNGTEIHFLENGDKLSIGEIRFSCLHPQAYEVYEDRNDKSLVFYVEYGEFEALFTGDLSQEEENHLLSAINHPIDLLKVGHHGSKYSTGDALLDHIRPKYAIISAGKNNRYGHPHEELLDRLKKHDVRIYQTMYSGAICIQTNGKTSIKIRAFLV